MSEKNYLYLLTFVSGMVVMAVELDASRVLAPFFGTSHYVWTNIIAVILAALSLGYVLGGKISEKSPKLKTLLSVVCAASLFLMLVPMISPFFGSVWFAKTFMWMPAQYALLMQSLIAMLVIFFIPVAFLGMVSPFIIKLFSQTEQAMGDVSGKVFAIGTAGSFLGTFLPAIVTIPLIGSKKTILLFATILFLTAAFGFLRKRHIAVVCLLIATIGLTSTTGVAHAGKLLYEKETPYQYMQVIQNIDGSKYLIFNEGVSVQSIYKDEKLASTHKYIDALSYAPELIEKRPMKVLVIGLAGGTIARNIKDLYGDQVKITGVEIDPYVVEAAKKFMGLKDGGIDVVISDGRTFLRNTDESFDVIIVDAYSNQLTIPFHLATQEFFMLVKAHLAENGIMATNINDSNEDSMIISSEIATLKTVFTDVMVADGKQAINYIVIAGNKIETSRLKKTKIGPEQIRLNALDVLSGLHPAKLSDARVLTDDWAPLEKMTDDMIWRYYREAK